MSVKEVKKLFIDTLRFYGAHYNEEDDVFEYVDGNFDPVTAFEHPTVQFIGRTGFNGGLDCHNIRHVMVFGGNVVVQTRLDASNTDESTFSYAIEEGGLGRANEVYISLVEESIREALDSVLQLTTLGHNGSQKSQAIIKKIVDFSVVANLTDMAAEASG